jgi:hypothetical protein
VGLLLDMVSPSLLFAPLWRAALFFCRRVSRRMIFWTAER